jgi:predicted double-glycine peptidase
MEEWFEKNQININPTGILVPLPHYQQSTWHSCGAAACRTLGRYYGVGPQGEAAWGKLLSTDKADGTKPINIVSGLRNLGLTVRVEKNLELDQLLTSLDNGNPVMCAIQAYGSHRYYRDLIWCGHWVIAIGYDEKYIFFEDPYVKRRRSFITRNKMVNRWADIDGDGRVYHRLGMTISGRPQNSYNLYKAVRIW